MKLDDFLPKFARIDPDPVRSEEKLKAKFRAMARGSRKKNDGTV